MRYNSAHEFLDAWLYGELVRSFTRRGYTHTGADYYAHTILLVGLDHIMNEQTQIPTPHGEAVRHLRYMDIRHWTNDYTYMVESGDSVFAEFPTGRAIKIGRATNVEKRLQSLPYKELDLLVVVPHNLVSETSLHRLFCFYRIDKARLPGLDGRTEWFSMLGDELHIMGSLLHTLAVGVLPELTE